MWPGPYGDFGSRKYMLASLDQSLKRLGLDYVDIFYSHRPDPATPIEETMGALDSAVRQGKALYAGISNYGPVEAKRAIDGAAGHGHSGRHPSAQLLDAQSMDRGPGCSTSWARKASACIVSFHLWRRAADGSVTSTGTPAGSRVTPLRAS